MMEAIVLAGGFGTRLRQVVPDLPKPMASVAGRPFLEILLTSLARKGLRRAVLSLGYMAEKIVNHFGTQFAGMDLAYEIEISPLGTGGAVRRALDQCLADHVFVFNGDTYLDIEIGELEVHWKSQRAPIIVARNVPDTARYGRLDTANGRVIGFCEKGVGAAGLINAGCYVFPTTILDGFSRDRVFSLETDFLAAAVTSERFDLFVTNGRFIDIGMPEDFVRAQIELAGVCD
jgi:D-glycero-alpha-D-manno-heptose 1-phosphate guanylyltransferase